MTSFRPALSMLFIATAMASAMASAEELALRFDTTLSLRTDAWSSTRQLDDGGVAQASVWANFKLKLDTGTALVGGSWLQRQTRHDSETPRGRVRELYLRHAAGPVELKIGRQLVLWGRADGFNPTDNLSPRDFTLLTPDDGDSRHGNNAAQLSIAAGAGTVCLLYFPHAASHTIPLESKPHVRYAVTAPSRSQWALKWDASVDGVDGSVSWFRGVDPMPDISIARIGLDGVDLAVRNNPVRILGGDISFTRGGTVWRAEAAWTKTDSDGGSDFTRKKSQLWLVAGGEWIVASDTTLGLQGTLQWVWDFQSPDTVTQAIAREVAWKQAATSNQTSATQVGMTWRLASRRWNDTLLAEVNGVVLWPSGSGVWRTRLQYALTDHWQWQIGTDYFFGPARGFFGQLGKNRQLHAQLRYGW